MTSNRTSSFGRRSRRSRRRRPCITACRRSSSSSGRWPSRRPPHELGRVHATDLERDHHRRPPCSRCPAGRRDRHADVVDRLAVGLDGSGRARSCRCRPRPCRATRRRSSTSGTSRRRPRSAASPRDPRPHRRRSSAVGADVGAVGAAAAAPRCRRRSVASGASVGWPAACGGRTGRGGGRRSHLTPRGDRAAAGGNRRGRGRGRLRAGVGRWSWRVPYAGTGRIASPGPPDLRSLAAPGHCTDPVEPATDDPDGPVMLAIRRRCRGRPRAPRV